MATLLKRQHRLPTLVLRNERDRSAGMQTVFLLQVGESVVERLTVPAAALNIPKDLSDLQRYEYTDPDYAIPPHVIAAIKGHMPAMLPPGAPLWLLFEKSPGFLPLVPWERLLQPQLGVPLLRVPNFLVNPRSDATALDVVLCASSPHTEPHISVEEVLLPIIRGLVQEISRRVRLDVFVDVHLYPVLRGRLDAEGLSASVQIHDPYSSQQTRAAGRSTAPGAAWLDWISATLAGRSIDLGYFVAHSTLSGTDGLLMVSETPIRSTDREIFIGAGRLDAFLTEIGAWAVGFSAPPQNYCGSGLRLLIEELAWMRPGPVMLHDAAVDPQGGALPATLRFLFSATRQAPASPAVSLYCHPEYVQPEVANTYDLQPASPIVDMVTLGDPAALSGSRRTKEETPGWLAKSQRVLEKTAAEVERTAELEDMPSDTQAGYENALRFVAGVLDQYADAPPSQSTATAGDQEQVL